MNQVLAPLSLVVLLLGPNALQLHEVGQFFLHREAIAAQLCVNKDVPGSFCAGTCQLAARMGALTGDQPESPMSQLAQPGACGGMRFGRSGPLQTLELAQLARGLAGATAPRVKR